MPAKTRKFFAGLVLLTGFIALIAWLLYSSAFQKNYPSIFPSMLAFFFLLNSLFFYLFTRINKKKNAVFIQQFMILFGVKFIVYLISAIVVILLFKKEAVNIAVSAMILYLLYTGYEVYWMTTLVKRKEQN
jgi:ABC-type Fe3+-siderophore transport system permease subunit